MSWVFGIRDFGYGLDIGAPPSRYYGDGALWSASKTNCRTWESAEQALSCMQRLTHQSNRKNFLDWMVRNQVQLEQF